MWSRYGSSTPPSATILAGFVLLVTVMITLPSSPGGVLTPVAAACFDNTNCTSCTKTPGCGWCQTDRECYQGSESGRSSGTCSNWRYYRSDPNGNGNCQGGCDNYGDCSSCTGTSYSSQGGANCGWCNAPFGSSYKAQCVQGSWAGPGTQTLATCSSDYWRWQTCSSPDSGGSSDTNYAGIIYGVIFGLIFGLSFIAYFVRYCHAAYKKREEEKAREAAALAAVPVYVPKKDEPTNTASGSSPAAKGPEPMQMASQPLYQAPQPMQSGQPAMGMGMGMGMGGQYQSPNQFQSQPPQQQQQQLTQGAGMVAQPGHNPYAVQQPGGGGDISDEQYKRALGISAGAPHMQPQQQPPQQYQYGGGQQPMYGGGGQQYGQQQQPSMQYQHQPPQYGGQQPSNPYAQPPPGYGAYQPMQQQQQPPQQNDPYAQARAMMAGQIVQQPQPSQQQQPMQTVHVSGYANAGYGALDASAPPPFASQQSGVEVPPYSQQG